MCICVRLYSESVSRKILSCFVVNFCMISRAWPIVHSSASLMVPVPRFCDSFMSMCVFVLFIRRPPPIRFFPMREPSVAISISLFLIYCFFED